MYLANAIRGSRVDGAVPRGPRLHRHPPNLVGSNEVSPQAVARELRVRGGLGGGGLWSQLDGLNLRVGARKLCEREGCMVGA